MTDLPLSAEELLELETYGLYDLADWETIELRGYLHRAVAEMRSSRTALRVLHDANAEGTCPTRPSAEAWDSEALREIREAIEEEA